MLIRIDSLCYSAKISALKKASLKAINKTTGLGYLALFLFLWDLSNFTAIAQRAESKDLIALEITRSLPIDRSQRLFDGGHFHPSLSYLHLLNNFYAMGFGTNFRIFSRKDSGDEVALATLSHISYAMIRLYHPSYLYLGPKIIYILPAKAAKFPAERHPDFENQVGLGASAMLVHFIFDQSLGLAARIDWWRGTKTRTFMGIELGFGVYTYF